MRLIVDLSTEYLKDRVCIPIRDTTATIKSLLDILQTRYEEWHHFKVYEFDIVKDNNALAKREDRIIDYFGLPESISLEQKIFCKARESLRSIEKREEDRRREEAERIAKEKERQRKEKERRQRIKQLKLKGECWQLENHSLFLNVPLDEEGVVVENIGSLDQWCSIKYVRPINNVDLFYFSVKIESDPPTTNTWRFCVGVVPMNFKWDAERHWVGSQKSFAYIAGTGGKCFDSGKSLSYGSKFGEGDIIGVLLNFSNGSIEFFKNSVSQGVAFNNLNKASYFPALSLCGKGARIRLLRDEIPASIVPLLQKSMDKENEKRKRWKEITSLAFEQRQLDEFGEHKHNSWSGSFSLRKDEALFFPKDVRDGSHSKPEHVMLCLNEGSDDKWRCARTIGAYAEGQHFFEVEVVNDATSTNTWRIAIGCVPIIFDSEADRMWIGAQKSWAYIAGSGGKCYNSGQMTSYSEPYNSGDVIGVFLDFDRGEIEFFKNGIPLGVAFSNLVGPVHGAVSLTAAGTKVRFVNSSIQIAADYRIKSAQKMRKMTEIVEQYGNVWNKFRVSKDILLGNDFITVENTSRSNKWRTAVAQIGYSSGRRYIEFHILVNTHTTNTWKLVVGLVGKSFNPKGAKIWIGAQRSWGYIAGTGGKVFDSGKSVNYGVKYGKGDRIGILMDFDNRTIEFYKNGEAQGIAFNDLTGPAYPAISFTGKGSKIKLDGLIENSLMDSYVLYH